jgi:hypothetical protein
MSGTDQNKANASKTMDAKSFLRAINNSAQAKIAFFESRIKKMGEEVGKAYALVRLDNNELWFEDKTDNTYYSADIVKAGGGVAKKIELTNITPIRVVEEKKIEDFDSNVNNLIEAIASENNKDADKAFKLIERQRFRPTVLPESGVVTTRDGVTRKVSLFEASVTENTIESIAEAFARATSDKVQISEGRVVRGTFVEDDQEFVIPINEMTRRRMAARFIKEHAESAYKSETFCDFVKELAGLVSEGRLSDAVPTAAEFLNEQQEFCVLTYDETNELVENALAVGGNFNSDLARDVTRLFYRTNLTVNRESIIEDWTLTAQKAGEASLMEDVKALDGAESFAEAYETLLGHVYNESNDLLSVRAKAYLVALKTIQSVLARTEGEEPQAEAMQEMIDAMESDNPDTNMIMQAETLLASVSDSIIDSVRNIENFDSSQEGDIDLGADAEDDVGDLLAIPDMGGAGGFDDMGMGDDMGALGEPAAAAPAPGGAFESKNKADKAISEEDFTPIEKMDARELEVELTYWKTHGHQYLKEDGFDDVNAQFERYIKRCMSIGPDAKALLEEFETIRGNIATYGDVVNESESDDPYAGSFTARFNARINDEYRGLNETAMDKAKGSGVAGKGTKTTDGSGSAGGSSAGKGKAAESTGGMDELQGKGGVQKQGVSKSEHLPDQPNKTKEVGGGHSQDGKGVAESVAMDTDLQGGGGVAGHGAQGSDGRGADNAAAGQGAAAAGGDKPAIDKASGKGVASRTPAASDGRHAGSTAASGGEAPEAGAPDDGITSKVGGGRSNPGKGVAEDDATEEDTDSVEEDQYKWGTKRQAGDHKGGRSKAKLAAESVQVTIAGDDENGRQVSYDLTDPNATADDMINKIVAELEAEAMGGEAPVDMGIDGGDLAPVDDMLPEPMGDEEEPDMGDEMELDGGDDVTDVIPEPLPMDGEVSAELDVDLAGDPLEGEPEAEEGEESSDMPDLPDLDGGEEEESEESDKEESKDDFDIVASDESEESDEEESDEEEDFEEEDSEDEEDKEE